MLLPDLTFTPLHDTLLHSWTVLAIYHAFGAV